MSYKANIHPNFGEGHAHAKVVSLEDLNFDQVSGIVQKWAIIILWFTAPMPPATNRTLCATLF
jgi:hypothetical protein